MLLMCINPNLSFQYDMMLSRPWVTMGVVFSSVLDGSSDSSKHSTWLTSWLHWLHVTTPPTSAVGTSTSGSTPAAANSSNTVSPPGQPNVVISSPAISFPVTSYSVCVPIESMTENIPIYLSLSYPTSTPFYPLQEPTSPTSPWTESSSICSCPSMGTSSYSIHVVLFPGKCMWCVCV